MVIDVFMFFVILDTCTRSICIKMYSQETVFV